MEDLDYKESMSLARQERIRLKNKLRRRLEDFENLFERGGKVYDELAAITPSSR